MIEAGISKTLHLNKAKTNWCPDCRQYTNQNHDCSTAVVARVASETSDSGVTREIIPNSKENQMETPAVAVAAPKKAAKKAAAAPKSNGHRSVTYIALTSKLDASKLKGQAAKVAKAILAYTTAQALDKIVEKVKANGDYKVKAEGGIPESVNFHLRRFVAEGLVKEAKIEKAE